MRLAEERPPLRVDHAAGSSTWPRHGWSAVKVAVTLLLVVLLCWTIDWRDSFARLGAVSWPWTAAALLLVFACIAISAWKWQLLLRAQGIRVGLPRLLRLYWVGIFFNNVMPSTIGGDVARLALARHIAGLGPVAASMLVERVSGLLVLVALAFATLTAQPGLAEARGVAVPVAVPVAVALLMGGTMLAFLLWRHRAVAIASTQHEFWRRPATARVLRRLRPLLDALQRYSGDHRALLVTCAVSVLFNAILILSHYTVICAVQGQLPLAQVALAAPLVIFAAALPVSINGIGIAEAAFVLLYGQFGLAPEVALAAALLRRIVIFAGSLIGAACWLAEHRPAPDSTSPGHQVGIGAFSSVPPSS
jgi:uncharacterized protein (TIRG00374 family)